MSASHEHLIWKVLQEDHTFTTPIFTLKTQRCRAPDAREQNFFVVRTRDWCNVIPVTEDGQVVLVKQYRHGTGKVSLEIPGGVADPEDTNLESAALRELTEETGYVPLPQARTRYLGWTWSNPAIFDNRVHSFVVGPVRLEKTQKLDSGELIEVVTLPIEEIPNAIRDGRIDHALIINAFFKLLIQTQAADLPLAQQMGAFRRGDV